MKNMINKETMRINRKLNLYFTFICFMTFFSIIIMIGILAYLGDCFFGWSSLMMKHSSIFWIIIFLAISLIGVISSIIIGRPILNSLNKLRIATKKISEGDFSYRIKDKYPKFLEGLTDDFNKMAKELEGTKILRNDFINNFSHEFKSPLGAIKLYASELKKGKLSKKEKDEYLDIIINEVDRLSNLSNSILNLSKVEKQEILTDREYINIAEQIRKVILLLMPRIEEKDLELDIDLYDYNMNISPMMEQVWLNILDNSIKFSNNKGLISIKSYISNNKYIIIFKDNGCGISDKDLPFIFEKFYKADKSHNSIGNGLGLSIVKRIVELHQGKISVDNKECTTFKIELI